VGRLDVLGEEARGEHAGCEREQFSHVYYCYSYRATVAVC
jgi:hypothetical protein